MRLEALADDDAVARAGAAFTAAEARAAVAARGRFVMAASGGHMLRSWPSNTCPGRMCTSSRWTSAWRRRETPTETSPTCARVCSRVVPCAPSSFNPCPWTRQTSNRPVRNTPSCFSRSPALRRRSTSPISASDPTAIPPPWPGDPVLDVTDTDVAVTGLYQGRRRMTLTYPMLNRSRRIVWLVTGPEKAEMLARLCAGDRSIPAGRITQVQAVVLADREAPARVHFESPLPY